MASLSRAKPPSPSTKMPLKKEILEKLPDYLKKEPEVKALLDYIEKQGIEAVEELVAYLKKERAEAEKWLEENKKRGGTMVKAFRNKSIQLKVLKKCEELVEMFLA